MGDMNNGDHSANKQMNPMAAGLAGAIIGAGVAVVTTKVLSDKKTRDRIIETLYNTRDKVFDSLKMAKREAAKRREEAEHRIRVGRRAVKHAASASHR